MSTARYLPLGGHDISASGPAFGTAFASKAIATHHARSRSVVATDDPQPGADQAANDPNAPRTAEGLRIALFSGNYNCVRDGANRALNYLVRHLLENGAEVRIYSPTVRHPAFAPAGDLVSVPSVPIPGRSEFRLALGLPRATRRDISDFGPNLVHVSAPDLLGVGAQRFARKLDVPVVASLHTRFETYLDYYGLQFLRHWGWNHLRRFYRASDQVLAPNAASATSLAAMGVPHDRIDLWGRGVNPGVFSPALRDLRWRRERGFRDDEIVPLFFGRLVLEKGIDRFAETIAELRRRGHHLRPLVVGAGPAEQRLRAMLGDALFTGHLDGLALGQAIASADMLINPSTTEAFGNVNLETMASGTAVISADAGSARALIESGKSGLLVEPRANALADAAERLMDDPGLRHGLARGGFVAASNYRWPTILDDVISSYRRLLQRRAAQEWPPALADGRCLDRRQNG